MVAVGDSHFAALAKRLAARPSRGPRGLGAVAATCADRCQQFPAGRRRIDVGRPVARPIRCRRRRRRSRRGRRRRRPPTMRGPRQRRRPRGCGVAAAAPVSSTGPTSPTGAPAVMSAKRPAAPPAARTGSARSSPATGASPSASTSPAPSVVSTGAAARPRTAPLPTRCSAVGRPFAGAAGPEGPAAMDTVSRGPGRAAASAARFSRSRSTPGAAGTWRTSRKTS